MAQRLPTVYVDIPCPGGTHERTILMYRDFSHAVLFCTPCEAAWSVAASAPAIRAVSAEQFPFGFRAVQRRDS